MMHLEMQGGLPLSRLLRPFLLRPVLSRCLLLIPPLLRPVLLRLVTVPGYLPLLVELADTYPILAAASRSSTSFSGDNVGDYVDDICKLI